MKNTWRNKTHTLVASVLLCAFVFTPLFTTPSLSYAAPTDFGSSLGGGSVSGNFGGNIDGSSLTASGGGTKDPTSPYEDPSNSWANGGSNGAGGTSAATAGAPTSRSAAARAAKAKKAAAAAQNPCKPTGSATGPGMPVFDKTTAGLTCQVQTNTKLTQTNTKKSAAMNTISAKKLGSLEKKEYILDGILFSIVKKLTQQLVKSTVQWISSGFQGSPMFVTNPQMFLLSAADQVAGEFINGAGLNSLCSPMNLRSALDRSYRASTGRLPSASPQCTLTGAANNATRSMGGGFGAAGGWGGWFQALSNPINTPYGGFMYAQEQLDNRISARQSSEKMQWDWGKGFLAKEECTSVSGQRVCKTTTPGDTIAQSLNFDLSIGKRELIDADEINEVISALLSQLASKALTGAGGLFGLSQAGQASGYGSSGNTKAQKDACKGRSYLDQLGSANCDGMTDGTGNTNATNVQNDTTISIVSGSVSSEAQYQEMNQRVSVAATSALTDALEAGCSASASPASGLKSIQTAANSTITESNLTTQALLAIQAQYDSGAETAQTTALASYNSLAASGSLHTDVYNATFQDTIDTVLLNISTLEGQISSCPSLNTGTGN